MRLLVLCALSILVSSCSLIVCPECLEGGEAVDGSVPDDADGGPDGSDLDADAATCSDAGCVECVSSMDCTGPAAMCSDAGACVECLGNEDCTAAGASVCSTDGACVACTPVEDGGSATDCAGVTDGGGVDGTALNVCDDSAGSGQCVQCNAGNENACGANVCDVVAKTCTDIGANSGGLCSTCVSDRQCDGEAVCAQERFEGTPTEFRCAWPLAAPAPGPAGACSNVPPYIGANADVATIGGAVMEVCQLRVATCASLQDYGTIDCVTLDGAGDARCGLPDVADGYCRRLDAAANRCTYQCRIDDDCRGSATCSDTVPSVCRF